MDFYIQDYRALRNLNMSKIHKAVTRLNDNNGNLEKQISYKDVQLIMNRVVPSKPTTPNVYFAKDMQFIRSFIYAISCDD